MHRRPMLWIVAGSIAAHVVMIPLLRPLLVSQKAADPAAEAQRTQQVAARELARQQRERERREQLRLDEQTARQLEAEAERRKRDELLTQVQELERAREQLEAIRLAALEQLAQRDPAAMIRRELEKIEQEDDGLRDDVRDLLETPDGASGDNARVEAQRKAFAEKLAALEQAARTPEPASDTNEPTDNDPDAQPGDTGDTPPPARDPSAIAEAARAAADQAAALAQTLASAEAREGNSDRRDLEAGNARRHAQRLERMARNVGQMAAGQPNDTASAEGASAEDQQLRAEAAAGESRTESAAQLYQRAVALEQSLDRANRDVRAAQLAQTTNTGFAESQAKLTRASPDRPDLAPRLAGEPAQTVGQLNAYRRTLQEAVGQTRDMATRSRGMVAQAGARQTGRPNEDAAARAARQARLADYARQTGGIIDLTGVMGSGIADGRGGGGTEDDDSLLGDEAQGPGMNTVFQGRGVALPQSQILQQAMPGRMFTDDSGRTGWLYLDTWYIIGPWENNRDIDFQNVHPPEYEIDFDAVYTDGKYADQPDHPDHAMTWQFMQSDQLRNQPPKVHPAATYYAYTEVYSDRARDVLISIGIDAAGRLWVNHDLVWEAPGRSGWRLGEAFRRIRLKAGYNTVLARVENGSGSCVWSVLLCPPEAVQSPERQ